MGGKSWSIEGSKVPVEDCSTDSLESYCKRQPEI